MLTHQVGEAGSSPPGPLAGDRPASAESGRKSARTRLSWASTGLSLGAVASALSFLWAAYTYSNQQAEQRRQDFLAAYNLVSGDLGAVVIKDVQAAIGPFYADSPITDPQWTEARACYDAVETTNGDRKCLADPSETAAAAQQRLFTAMQSWIATRVLVKGKDAQHDGYIHNYQYAANDLKFLYQYAQADPCNWTVVAFKFRKYAYDFWYYYPGSYSFSTASTQPSPAEQETEIRSGKQEADQANACLEGFKSLPNRILDLVPEPIRRIF
jgi:hypothetical protein